MSDELLLASIDIAAADLDTATSAWVVVLGRLVDADLGSETKPGDLEELIQLARDNAGFPLGPISYVRDAPVLELRPRYDSVVYQAQQDGKPYIDALVGAGPAAFVAVGGTRHGWLGDGEQEPSHILVSDVEVYIGDLVALLCARASQLKYRGPGRVGVAIRSDVPGRPLRLRSLDESTGELAPVRADLDHFDVIEGDFEIDYEHILEPDSLQRLHGFAWSIGQRIAPQFGLERPQLMTPPGVHGDTFDWG